jgi:hypothetical protein
MNYSIFLFSKLFDCVFLETTKDMEYDILYELVQSAYKAYYESKQYHNLSKSEYDCILDFLYEYKLVTIKS